MNKNYLDNINSPDDLKKLNVPELALLAREIREYMINVISKTGGHLAPSLGTVELTLALHYVFNAPCDKIIWDVGHQSYTHKIITGRKDLFHTIRQYKGISGFPRIDESKYDTFGVGHASTSISAALGYIYGRDLNGENYHVVAVIGDGALTGGEAFEGLNNAGASKKDIIVIINDNEMSISRNVGAMASYLAEILTSPSFNKAKTTIWNLTGKLSTFGERIRYAVSQVDQSLKAVVVPGLLFERLGFRYVGPIDGHNLAKMIKIFQNIKKYKGPQIVHLLTKKGKGYKFAEKDACKYHGIGSFEMDTGNSISSSGKSYSKVLGSTLTMFAETNPKIVAITAAMSVGTGLNIFEKKYPDRFFDVGIAEQHAVTFSASLALQGFIPVVAIYSTFLQRAYDQIIHDVALQNLPVVFAIDRAGIVGEDGPTHHGTMDLSYLRAVPNMVIMSPKDEAEFQDMLWTAVNYRKGPVAIRYPRGAGTGNIKEDGFEILEIGRGEILEKGEDAIVIALGRMVGVALKANKLLKDKGISTTVVNARFVKPLDEKLILDLVRKNKKIFTIEENVLYGGFGSAVAELFVDRNISNIKMTRFGIKDKFITHGKVSILLKEVGLDSEKIAELIYKKITNEEYSEKSIQEITI
ncbi:1-deoxy-D-xylulose-5-phosphate synthase [candidate division KSB1 bacterium]|nr:MAG: 1-deoxy-D-xylulose-5-phosphate synthase [candidate division KSB1 bacterium]